MTRARRHSPQAVAVLQALAARPDGWRYGYELGQEVGLKAGSLYPILIRLADRGLLEAAWEPEPPAGRPRRHMYRLTSDGSAEAQEIITAARPVPRRAASPRQRPLAAEGT